jgi:prepilin peptidase CpaA
VNPFAATVFCGLLGLAAVSDLRSYRIPNALCAALAVSALVFAAPDGLDAWLSRGASVLTVGVAVLALYLLRGMGGGDVKLLAATACWISFATLPVFVLVLGLAGGVQALVRMGRRRLALASGAAPPPRRLPYGLSIAVAGWIWALAILA